MIVIFMMISVLRSELPVSANIMVLIKGAMSSIWVIGISGPSSREGRGGGVNTEHDPLKTKTEQKKTANILANNKTLVELVIHVKIISPPPPQKIILIR